MKSIGEWLGEYQQSHQNPTNKTLHWICIPPIVFSVFGMLRAVPVGSDVFNVATVGALLALTYYLALSWRLALGAAVIFSVFYAGVLVSYHVLGPHHFPAMIGLFVLAWVGQFVGHAVEGAKPSFFKDLQFLLIGPLWLLADLYRRLDIAVDGRRVVHG